MIKQSRLASLAKWWEAYCIVLSGPASVVGKGFRWKQAILMFAIVGAIATPFITFYSSRPYQGIIPSNDLLTKAFGRVIFGNEQRGVKSVSIADFITDSGIEIRLKGDYASLSKIKEWGDRYPLQLIYIEGFQLRNGAGPFWISYATTSQGDVLLGREEQLTSLVERRNPFGKSMLAMFLFQVVPLWIYSLINIRKVRISLGT
nr:hypothetical protein [Paraburkholderia sp. BL8N3]